MGLERSFSERLSARCAEIDSYLCVGIDPRPDRFPSDFSSLSPAEATRRFSCRLLDLCAPYVAAAKLQSAFFEALGAEGHQAWLEVARHAKALGILTIADVKRGDIGSTAAAYADASFGNEGESESLLFDAITVNPWFGSDGVRPFFDAAAKKGGGVFLLVKTSNPSSSEILDLPLANGGLKLHEHVANMTKSWGEEFGDPDQPHIGAVVGATHGEALARMRELMPKNWFLVPGVGAQGATMDDARHAFSDDGDRALVSLSRGLSEPWGSKTAPGDWEDLIEQAARSWRDQLREALHK